MRQSGPRRVSGLKHLLWLGPMFLWPAQFAQAQSVEPAGPLPGVELVSLSSDDLLLERIENAERVMASLDDRAEMVRALRMGLERTLEREYRTRPPSVPRAEWNQGKALLRARINAAEAKLQFYMAHRQLLRAQIDAFARERELQQMLRAVQAGEVDPATDDAALSELAYLETALLHAIDLVARREEVVAQRRREFVERQTEVAGLRRTAG